MSATVYFLHPAALRRFIAPMTDEVREIFGGMVRCSGAGYVLNWREAGRFEKQFEYFHNSC